MDFTRKYIFVILIAIGILSLFFQATILGYSSFCNTDCHPRSDYSTYYFAGKHFEADDNVYFSSKQNIKYDQAPLDDFVYPPLMAVFFVPLALVSLVSSYNFFTVLSGIIFLLSAYLLSKKVPNSKYFFWLSAIAFFTSPILVAHLSLGQTDIVTLFFIVAGLISFMQKRSILSGTLVGVAASLKLTPLIFLPYFFIKDRKAFWSSVITITIISAFFTVDVWADFLERIHSFAGSFSSGNGSNSLFGVLYNKYIFDYYSHSTVSLAYLLIVILILIATFFLIYKNKEPNKFVLLEYGIMAIFMMILPSVAWIHNGVHSLFVLAAYWSVRFNGSLNKWTYFFFDILVYLLLSQPLLSPLVRNFPIYHIFSLRPLIYLCFVALFIYIIHKEKIHAYIAKFKLTRFYTGSFIRFCVVGLAGTASNLLVFYLVLKAANINIAAVCAFAFAVTQNYILNHSWSFKNHHISRPNIKGYQRYLFVNLFGLALNLIVLNALVGLGLNALVAQVVGVFAGVSLNYAGSYFFVFARKASA